MAFWSSVFSEYCGVASAMRCRYLSRASGERGGYLRYGVGLLGTRLRTPSAAPTPFLTWPGGSARCFSTGGPLPSRGPGPGAGASPGVETGTAGLPGRTRDLGTLCFVDSCLAWPRTLTATGSGVEVATGRLGAVVVVVPVAGGAAVGAGATDGVRRA